MDEDPNKKAFAEEDDEFVIRKPSKKRLSKVIDDEDYEAVE